MHHTRLPGPGAAICLAACLVAFTTHGQTVESEAAVVAQGKVVSIEYALKLDDGTTADTNVGGDALKFTIGGMQILPALESELLGLKPGDSKKVDLSAENGYGPVRPDAFVAIEIAKVPEEFREKGKFLAVQDQTGRQHKAKIHELKDDEVVLDLNHPLAGENLHFEVKILAIE